jgi:hypothetical protein
VLFLFVIGEVGKLLGAKWKELSDEEKKVCSLSLVALNLCPPCSCMMFCFN